MGYEAKFRDVKNKRDKSILRSHVPESASHL